MKKIFGLVIALMFFTTMAYGQAGGGGLVIHGGNADLYDNLTVHGKFTGSASTTSMASINLPQGTAPSVPVNGDMWATSAGLYVYINSAVVGPLGTGGGGGLSGGTQYYLPVWTSSTSLGSLAALGSSGAPLISGGAGANPAWATYLFSGTAAQTYTFPTTSKTLMASDYSNAGTIPLANETVVTPYYLGLQRGSNLALAFSTGSPKYTKTTTGGLTITETDNTMTVAGSASGADSFTPTTSISGSLTANTVVEVDVPVTTSTAGTWWLTMGGVTLPTVTYSQGVGTYVFYVLLSSTANPVINCGASGTQTLVFGNISIKEVGSATGVLNIAMIVDTNSGASAQRVVYTPVASVGLQFCEYVIAAYAVVLKSGNGSDSFYLGTTAYTTSLTLGTTRQTFISLGSYVANVWDLLGLNGSVTGA